MVMEMVAVVVVAALLVVLAIETVALSSPLEIKRVMTSLKNCKRASVCQDERVFSRRAVLEK